MLENDLPSNSKPVGDIVPVAWGDTADGGRQGNAKAGERNVFLSAAVLDLALRVPPSTLQVTRGASPLEFTGPGTLYRIRGTLFTLAFKQEMQPSPAAPRLATLFLLFLFTLLSFQPFP